MTDCSLNYKFNTWKFQAQTWGEHIVYRNCFWHSEQFLYTTCSTYVLQKEELLTKIYLYYNSHLLFHFRYSLDHIVRERYPTFVDAIRDLEDCLCLCFLYATFPKSPKTPVEMVWENIFFIYKPAKVRFFLQSSDQ